MKDAESPRSSTHDGADQKLELVRKISALFCKVAKRRAERWTFDEAAHELDKQRRWNSEGYDWWLTWLESRSKAGEITLLDGNAQADEINAALRADRNWRSEFAPRLPSARQASERRAGRWDYVMDANAWWLADSIAPINAAMLLSRRNPNVEKIEDAETNSSDEMEPQDFRRLKNIFEGADKEPRTLKAWTAYARERGLKIHSWINEWEAWVQEVDARQLPGGSALVPPVTGVETESASGGGAKAVTGAPATEQKWGLKKPDKLPGYRKALYDYMKDAHTNKRPCPKAQDVLNAWTTQPPGGIKVMPRGIEYLLGTNQPKKADMKAIQAAIKNLVMLSK